MEASLTLIPISPCIFIMAPRVTPARCMKCPASCHPCPLSLHPCYLFLLPLLLLLNSRSSAHFCLFWVLKESQIPILLNKCDVSLEPRKEACVLLSLPLNPSQSTSSYSSSMLSWPSSFFVQTLPTYVVVFSKRTCDAQVNLCLEEKKTLPAM